MPERCRFPLCKSWATDNGLCTSHGKYFNTDDFKGVAKAAPSSKPVNKQRKPVKKVSDKMKQALADLKKLVKRKLAEQPECELKMEGCTGKATTAHHSKGRIGKQLLNYKNLMSSCANCNRVCEEKDAEAREKGIKKSQHSIQ